MALLVGKKLGKYEIIERIGKGGMAEVYKAYHSQLDREVAVKVLYSHLAEGKEFLKRFEHEAKSVAALKHPNIVRVHDFDNQNDLYYMVFEYIKGGTVGDLMKSYTDKQQYISSELMVKIFKQLISALDYAHKKGLIHRDIKPSNILIDEDDNAFLTDFGIAKMMSGISQMTSTGSLIGTPAYMSPEQGLGKELTSASDLYSLGVILFQMLIGRVPFESDTPLAVIQAQINSPVPSPTDLRANLPKKFENIISKTLAKRPEERYQSGQALIKDLEPVLIEMQNENRSPGITSQPTRMLSNIKKDGEGIQNMATVPLKKQPPPSVQKKRINEIDQQLENELIINKPVKPFILFQKPYLYIILVMIVLAISWFAFLQNLVASPGESCATPEACLQLAEENRINGQLNDAIYWYDQAIKISGNDRGMAAGFWCDKGDLHFEIGDSDEARKDFQTCFDWAENDPGLQDLRFWAEEGLARISNSVK